MRTAFGSKPKRRKRLENVVAHAKQTWRAARQLPPNLPRLLAKAGCFLTDKSNARLNFKRAFLCFVFVNPRWAEGERRGL